MVKLVSITASWRAVGQVRGTWISILSFAALTICVCGRANADLPTLRPPSMPVFLEQRIYASAVISDWEPCDPTWEHTVGWERAGSSCSGPNETLESAKKAAIRSFSRCTPRERTISEMTQILSRTLTDRDPASPPSYAPGRAGSSPPADQELIVPIDLEASGAHTFLATTAHTRCTITIGSGNSLERR